MLWVSQNTPKDSKFLILSGETQLMRDPIQEWFPALAERRSQTTLQGLEWVWGEKFIDSILTFQELIACFRQNLSCITNQAAQLQISFDHLYIKKLNGKNCGDNEL